MSGGGPASIAAIVLAAGRSSRFGGENKLLANVRGSPLIRRTLFEVASAPVEPIILVVAPDSADTVAAAAGEGRWHTIVNRDAGEGIAASLRAGLTALPQGAGAALVVLADMPGLSRDLIRRVTAAYSADPAVKPIVYPVGSDGRQGHPVLWPADLFPELLMLRGDQGGKPLLTRHAARIVTVPSGGSDATSDIDTPADLAAYLDRDEP